MTKTCNMTPEANIDRPESMNEKERLEQKLQDWGAMKAFLVSEEGRRKYGDEMRNVILERVKRNINEIEERLGTITAGPGQMRGPRCCHDTIEKALWRISGHDDAGGKI